MSVRLPLQSLLSYNDTGNVGATSVVSKQFTIPQDVDSVVLKVGASSVNGTAPVVDIYLQTSDDGGTTYYDQGHLSLTSTVTSSVLAVTNAKALWMATPVAGASSIAGVSSMRSTTGNTVTGLPILGTLGQIQIAYSGTITTNNGVLVTVYANSQSARQ